MKTEKAGNSFEKFGEKNISANNIIQRCNVKWRLFKLMKINQIGQLSRYSIYSWALQYTYTICVCVRTWTHTHGCLYVHVDIYIYIIYIYIHTYTQNHSLSEYLKKLFPENIRASGKKWIIQKSFSLANKEGNETKMQYKIIKVVWT